MKRTLRSGVLVVLAVTVGAGLNRSTAEAGPGPATRAAKLGAFPDNPLLARVPASTPYVFASFRPMPADYLAKMYDLVAPTYRKMAAQSGAQPAFSAGLREAQAAIGKFDSAHLAKIGVSARARFVIYGMGPYPAMRVELADGPRLVAFMQRVVARMQLPLPPGIARAGYTYWIAPVWPTWSLLVAVGANDLVIAAAPPAELDGELPALLGEQPVAQPLTTADLRAVAQRDGYTGLGVGYVDVASAAVLAGRHLGLPAACGATLGQLAGRAPRVSFGYSELSAHRLEFGMVVELAADLAHDASALGDSIAGYDRLLASRPIFAFALAANLTQARALAPRLGGVLRDLGQRCRAPGVTGVADRVDQLATTQLPPAFEKLHGAVAALDQLRMNAGGPPTIGGWAVASVDDADQMIATALMLLPGLQLATDGKPYALPAGIPFPGHLAAATDRIALALGPASAKAAVAALRGRRAPAPLATVVIDYTRFASLLAATGQDVASMRAFGIARMQLVADDRGLVVWSSFELR